MNRRRIVCLAILLQPVVCSQQPPASDEIRVSSQPYTAQSPFTVRVETRLVDVGVTVRDSHGRAVAGLKKDDFRLLDDGKQRAISTFSEDVNGAAAAASETAANLSAGSVPASAASERAVTHRRKRFLALFFDDIDANYGEDAGDLKRAQSAATRFLKASLQPGMQVGIFSASGTQTLDFTSDGAKLEETIAALKAHPRFSQRICPAITPYQAFRVAQNRDRETIRLILTAANRSLCPASVDSIMVQSEEIWRGVKETSAATLAAVSRAVTAVGSKPGERVLLFASSGFASGTLEPQEDRIIDQAVHSGVVINSLVTKGLYNELTPGERLGTDTPVPGSNSGLRSVSPRYQSWIHAEAAEVAERPAVMDEAMANLARGTGGVLFHNNNDLNAGFRETSVAPEITYRMSFNPEGVASDGSFHELQVKLIHPVSYSVEARPGYFAPDQLAMTGETARAKLEHEVMGSDSLAGLPAGAALRVEKTTDTQRTLHVVMHVDISKLSFLKQNDRQNQRITIVAAFFDQQGKMITAKEGKMDLALTPETYSRLAGTGVNAELSFQMAPGVYKMRAVVGEAVNGGLAASTYPIDLR